MSWADAFRLAARSVLRRPGRAALTVVAVALAAALFTAMLTMAATAQGRVLNQLAKGGPLAGIQVAAAASDPSQLGSDNPTQGPPKPIDQAALTRISHVSGVGTVLPIVTAQTLVIWPGHTTNGAGGGGAPDDSRSVVFDQLVGVDLTHSSDLPITISAGRLPAPGSLTQVVVTPVFLARYGITNKRGTGAIGSVIELGAPRGFRGPDGSQVFPSRWTQATVVGVAAQQAGSGGAQVRTADTRVGAVAVGEIRNYHDPAGLIDSPTGIIGAPNGDVWFTSIGNSRVGRVRADGVVVETFADPTGSVQLPANIFPGADGRIWFTCLGTNRLGAIDPSSPDPASTIRTYGRPDLDKPVALKATADGRLWFSLRGSDAIGCLDPKATDPPASIRIFHSAKVAGPAALIPGPDRRIWWVNARNDTIGWLDPAVSDPGETIGVFGPSAELDGPRAWAIDGSDRLWLTTQGMPGLVSFEPSAADPASTLRRVSHPRLRTPDGMWLGADGALWLADTDADAIVRFDPSASTNGDAWSFFGERPFVEGPFDIKSGADTRDGFLWFTNKTGNSIGRISTGVAR